MKEPTIRDAHAIASPVPGRPFRHGVPAASVAATRSRCIAPSALDLPENRPRIAPADRVLWACLARAWSGWRNHLFFVKPSTVIAWQRRRFRDHERRLGRARKPGRPAVSKDLRDLIRRISRADPTWGSPRIVAELRKLGIDVARSTVETYPMRPRGAPSPTWRAFLNSHMMDLVSVDFFTVPTVRCQVLFVFLVLAHHRRRVVHFNVTERPTSQWSAQQIVEAFPFDTAPKYLLRDRDAIYRNRFRARVRNLGIEAVRTAPRSPWRNPYVERLIGSIRRECLDHAIVLNDRHLKRMLASYFRYDHRWKTHRSLEMDSPNSRPVQPPELGEVIEFPDVHSLQRHYERCAA